MLLTTLSLLFSLLSTLTQLIMALPIVRRDDSSSPKYVVAHFMVGNSYNYVPSTWTSDIKLAHSFGIDGFALNIGSDVWQPDRVADAYNAAAASGLDFKLFISFDMSVLSCTQSSDVQSLQQYLQKFNSHAAQLMINGKALVSTFSGDQCTFGASSPAAGWANVFNGFNVQFVPAFFPTDMNTISPSQPLGALIDGIFPWNSGWPMNLLDTIVKDTTSLPTDLLSGNLQSQLGDLSMDDQWLTAIGLPNTQSTPSSSGKTYIAAASPHFYTHYPGDGLNKNFVYITDNNDFAKRWDSIIQARDHIDVVEIITWNDYGESHYIGPYTNGLMPTGTTWVDGFDHQGWAKMVSYYAQAFKTGSLPAVEKDVAVMWARPQSKSVTAPSDSIGKPANVPLLSDTFWAWILLADNNNELSQVTLSIDSSNSKVFTLPPGPNFISIPMPESGNAGPLTLHATISRGGQTTVDLTSSNFTWTPAGGQVPVYNYNAAVWYSSS